MHLTHHIHHIHQVGKEKSDKFEAGTEVDVVTEVWLY
jgi:hypothetical protein